MRRAGGDGTVKKQEITVSSLCWAKKENVHLYIRFEQKQGADGVTAVYGENEE